MPSLLRKMRTLLGLSLREKMWLLFLYPYSGFVRLAILTIPHKILSRHYGHIYSNTQLSLLTCTKRTELAWRIGKIAQATAAHTPWKSECLVQALIVRTMLKYYKIPHVLHLGALTTKDPKEPIKAHAWIEVGPWVVSGNEGHEDFKILATFTSIDLSSYQHLPNA